MASIWRQNSLKINVSLSRFIVIQVDEDDSAHFETINSVGNGVLKVFFSPIYTFLHFFEYRIQSILSHQFQNKFNLILFRFI